MKVSNFSYTPATFLLLAVAFIALPLLGGCIQEPLPEQPGNFSIDHVNVIPMTGRGILSNQTVVIKEGRIVTVAPSGSVPIDPSSELIDGSGQYLIPGLSDMHVHFYAKPDAILWPANGVTLIRNMFGWPMHLKWREEFRNRSSIGPEMFAASPIMDGPDPAWLGSVSVTSTEQARELVTDYVEQGYDGIKVYSGLSSDVFHEIVAAAKKRNVPVWGHIPFDVGVFDAVGSGLESAEHLMEYIDRPDLYEAYKPGESIDYSHLVDFDAVIAATVANNVWNCPTLVVWDRLDRLDEFLAGDQSLMRYVNPISSTIWSIYEPHEQHMEQYYEAVYRLHKGGAKLLIGTDTGNPYVIPGFSVHDEMRLLVERANIPPYDVLLMATRNAAEMLGIDDRIGTVEVGKEADLVLLNRNPLDDISATQDIAAVIVDGAFYDRDELDAMLEYVAELYGNFRNEE